MNKRARLEITVMHNLYEDDHGTLPNRSCRVQEPRMTTDHCLITALAADEYPGCDA